MELCFNQLIEIWLGYAISRLQEMNLHNKEEKL